MNTYTVFVEVRMRGAIGMFSESRYTVVANNPREAAKAARERASQFGQYETRGTRVV